MCTRGTLRVCKRSIHAACITAGIEGDGRGRWAVSRVLDWRGGYRNREALVEWAGFDRVANRPWPNSWVARRMLTEDLRKEGSIRPKIKRVADTSASSAETRKSPRLAGEIPVAGLMSDRKRRSVPLESATQIVAQRNRMCRLR